MKRIALIIALALGCTYSALADRGPAEPAPDLPDSLFAPLPGGESDSDSDDFDALADPPVSAPEWFAIVAEGRAAQDGDLAAVKGRRSISEERALVDAREQLEAAVADWLGPDVPADWSVPAPVLDSMILARHIESLPTDRVALGLDPELEAPDELYVAAFRADFSPSRRAELVEAYRRDLGTYRLTVLGGVIGFILACLAILSAYIRADEATRGYYTNRLRLVAAAAAGAAGVAIYRFLV